LTGLGTSLLQAVVDYSLAVSVIPFSRAHLPPCEYSSIYHQIHRVCPTQRFSRAHQKRMSATYAASAIITSATRQLIRNQVPQLFQKPEPKVANFLSSLAGLNPISIRNPPMNRWAIVFRPPGCTGAGNRGKSKRQRSLQQLRRAGSTADGFDAPLRSGQFHPLVVRQNIGRSHFCAFSCIRL